MCLVDRGKASHGVDSQGYEKVNLLMFHRGMLSKNSGSALLFVFLLLCVHSDRSLMFSWQFVARFLNQSQKVAAPIRFASLSDEPGHGSTRVKRYCRSYISDIFWVMYLHLHYY